MRWIAGLLIVVFVACALLWWRTAGVAWLVAGAVSAIAAVVLMLQRRRTPG